MSTLNLVNQLSSKTLPTAVANILSSQSRLNCLLTDITLGAIDITYETPSESEYTLLATNGKLVTKSLDVSAVPESQQVIQQPTGYIMSNVKMLTINLNTFKELSQQENQVASTENKRIPLVFTVQDPNAEPCGCGEDIVKIFLTNDNVIVKKNQLGNPIPPYYLLGRGQIKYLLIVNGRISQIMG